MATWTVDETLASIRTRADLLDSDARFSDTSLLLLLNEELGSWLVPLIAQMLSEYFVTTLDTVLTGATNLFNVPGDAVAGRVRLVQFLDANLRPRFNCVQVDPMDNVQWFASPWLGNLGQFYFQGDQLILLGPLPAGWYLRIAYERRPAQCVLIASCARITVIAGNVVTVNAFPAAMVAATPIDFVRGVGPWTTIGAAALPTPSGLTVTFTTLPTGLAVGDYLALRGQAPFCQVPQECIPVLRQWVAIYCASIKADQGLDAASGLLKATDLRMRKVLSPRSVGNKKAVGNGLASPVGGWPGIWGA